MSGDASTGVKARTESREREERNENFHWKEEERALTVYVLLFAKNESNLLDAFSNPKTQFLIYYCILQRHEQNSTKWSLRSKGVLEVTRPEKSWPGDEPCGATLPLMLPKVERNFR